MLLSLSFPITLDANGHLVEAKLDKILSKDKNMSHFESNNTSVFFCLLIKVMFEVMIKTAASIIGGYFRSKEIYGAKTFIRKICFYNLCLEFILNPKFNAS